MKLYNTAWELFSKTGAIDAYLLYKIGTQPAAGSDYNGEHKDKRTDNQSHKLR